MFTVMFDLEMFEKHVQNSLEIYLVSSCVERNCLRVTSLDLGEH